MTNNPKKLAALLVWLVFCTETVIAQRIIPLYASAVAPNTKTKSLDIPNKDSSVYHRVAQPSLRVYLPHHVYVKRPAVIICAGGGYAELNIKREGYTIADAFNKAGVVAFVLKYRLPDDCTNSSKSTAPLQDLQQAIKMVRDSATNWNIDPEKIGVMGFSAGGHLASSAGVHFADALVKNKIANYLRPDFMLLVYPVISFGNEYGHIGSRNNLVGRQPHPDSVRYFSNELWVTKETPPTFLVHPGDDNIVPVANSIKFYEALQKAGVNADLHIYAKGGHGFGVQPSFDEWFGRCLHWMKSSGFAY